MKTNHKISVLMGAYNEEEYVGKAIESILNQTYTNFEFVIVNDGSTDNTLEILKGYTRKDKRIKIIDKVNTGLTKSLNVGLKYCDGDYIARMDADNISLPTRLEKQVNFLEKNKDYAVVGSWRIDIFPEGKERILKLPTSNKEVQKALVKGCVISHSAVMVRANILKKYRYNEKFRYTQDYELWTRIGKKYKLANLDEVLTKAYHRKGSITRTKNKIIAFMYNMIVHYKAYKNLKCPWWYFIYMSKPILESIIPRKMIEKYVDLKKNTVCLKTGVRK